MLLIMKTCLYVPLLFIPLSLVRSVSCLIWVKLLQHWAKKKEGKVRESDKTKEGKPEMWNTAECRE